MRCALATRNAVLVPSVPGALGGVGEGALWVGSYLASTSEAGRLPGPRPGTAAAAAERIRLLPRRRLPFICSVSSSFPGLVPLPIAAPALAPAWPLQSHRSLQQLAQSATGFLAAHSSRHRESGPAPREGAAGKLESGLNRLRRGSRTSTQPRAPPGAKVLHRHPPGPPPKKTWSRQKPGAHATTGWRKKKSLLRILVSSEPAQEALAAFRLARAPPSGPSRPRSAARSGKACGAGRTRAASGGQHCAGREDFNYSPAAGLNWRVVYW